MQSFPWKGKNNNKMHSEKNDPGTDPEIEL